MTKNVDLGFPEVAVVSGTWLLCNNLPIFGTVMCVFGIIGATSRAIIRVQQHQEEAEERKKWYQDLNVTEIGLMNAFAGTNTRKKEDDVFH